MGGSASKTADNHRNAERAADNHRNAERVASLDLGRPTETQTLYDPEERLSPVQNTPCILCGRYYPLVTIGNYKGMCEK